MVSDLGELISRYEAAKDRLENLIDSGTESETELIEADRALSVAFSELLKSRMTTGQQVVQRLHYLLQLIRENQPGNQLVARLTDQILQDIQTLEFDDKDSVEAARSGSR